MDKPEPKMWYENYQNKLQAEQAGKSSQEVEQMLSNKVDDLGQTVYSTMSLTPIIPRPKATAGSTAALR
jgi:hypothetical protein